jgi:uncharacterized tellurite resistance protein B-like protein
MGLLSRLAGAVTPQKKATDDVLLLHGMLLMAGADGMIEHEEIETVEAYFATLPEFEGKDFGDLLQQANKVVHKFGNLKDSVKAVGEISNPAVKKKLYVIAADLAMSSGDVDEAEDAMLDTFQRLLDVDDAFATKTLEVLAVKYAK